jgi:hypothetical protein
MVSRILACVIGMNAESCELPFGEPALTRPRPTGRRVDAHDRRSQGHDSLDYLIDREAALCSNELRSRSRATRSSPLRDSATSTPIEVAARELSFMPNRRGMAALEPAYGITEAAGGSVTGASLSICVSQVHMPTATARFSAV